MLDSKKGFIVLATSIQSLSFTLLFNFTFISESKPEDK